ncbi:hypothetical protein Thermus77927_09280 [Thermus hydrothermalis]
MKSVWIRRLSLGFLSLGLLLVLAMVVREVRWYALASHPPEDIALPSVSLFTLDGGIIDLRAYLGTPLVVNLWASWCPPCQRELPMMARVAEEGGVLFLFVAVKDKPERVKDFLREHRIKPSRWTRFFLGDEPLIRAVYTVGLPTTLFFGSDGKARGRHLGEIDEKTLREKVEVLK